MNDSREGQSQFRCEASASWELQAIRLVLNPCFMKAPEKCCKEFPKEKPQRWRYCQWDTLVSQKHLKYGDAELVVDYRYGFSKQRMQAQKEKYTTKQMNSPTQEPVTIDAPNQCADQMGTEPTYKFLLSRLNFQQSETAFHAKSGRPPTKNR